MQSITKLHSYKDSFIWPTNLTTQEHQIHTGTQSHKKFVWDVFWENVIKGRKVMTETK